MDPTHTTLQALSQINAENFEALIPAFLRRRSPSLAGLVQTGANEQGEFIDSPVDGLYVHSRLPVAYAVTTTDRDELNRKWLGAGQGNNYRKGDIQKFAELLAEDDYATSDSKPVLYLATNLPLSTKTDIKLQRRAVEKGAESGVTVEFVEASQLVDFLDNTADGQYLRHRLLGIDAERLSEDLLRHIAEESLRHHYSSVTLVPNRQSQVIDRDVQPNVLNRIADPSNRVVGLRGLSGMGKSLLAERACQEINTSGGCAIWVSADMLESFDSTRGILNKVLHRYHPALSPIAADTALELAAKFRNGLVLLVDDINRLQVPSKALATIRALARGSDDGQNTPDAGSLPPVTFLVPLWPGQEARDPWHTASPSKAAAGEQIDFVDMPFLSNGEIEALAQLGDPQHSNDMSRLLYSLGGDPLLCGLALANLSQPFSEDRSQIVRDIFENTVEGALRQAQELGPAGATQGDYRAALSAFIQHALRRGEPAPVWREVRRELGDRDADLLHALNRTNSLGWIETDAEDERWQWKHERLRDALIGRWLAVHIAPHCIADTPTDEDVAWLNDPGLAEAWAMALVFVPNEADRETLIGSLAENHALALAEALRQDLFIDNPRLSNALSTRLASVLAGYPDDAEEFVSGQRGAILAKLARTYNVDVLSILDGLKDNFLIWEARLRNGDLSGGIEWIKRHKMDFLPGSRYLSLESAIRDFEAAVAGARDTVVTDLQQQALSHPDSFYAAAQLAGYLAWPELARPVWEAWNTLDLPYERKLQMLDAVVWAIARCGDEGMRPQLEQALLSVREISDEGRAQGKGSDRMWQFLHPMRFSSRWPISNMGVETYIKVAREQPDLDESILYFLAEMDDSEAVAYYAESIAKGKWTGHLKDGESIDPVDETRRNREGQAEFAHWSVPVKPQTRERLWQLVTGNDLGLSAGAFTLWKRFATQDDLQKLETISEGHALFNEALKVRLKLGDRSAAPYLIKHMEADLKGWPIWSGYAPFIYDAPGVAEAFFASIKAQAEGELESKIRVGAPKIGAKARRKASRRMRRREQVVLPFLAIKHIPPGDLRRLISEQRKFLLRWPRAWCPLWQSGVPEALALVRDAFAARKSTKRRPPSLFFTPGGFPYVVSRRMLDVIAPFLDLFSEGDHEYLVELCTSNGFQDWAAKHLPDKVAEGEERRLLSQQAAEQVLNSAVKKVPEGVRAVFNTEKIYTLIEPFSSQADRAPKAAEWTRAWLQASEAETGNVQGSRVAVAGLVISSRGTADDITWWRDVHSDDQLGEEIQKNTLFALQRRAWLGADTEIQ